MSVIAKNESNGKVFSFVKGADIAILQRLSEESRTSQPACIKQMDDYAVMGFRTLMFAMKELSALTTTKSLEDCTPEMIESQENEVSLLGITALEDLL